LANAFFTSSPAAGYFCFPFLNFIFDFLLELLKFNVYIYQYKAFNDKLQNMPKSVFMHGWHIIGVKVVIID